MHLEHDDICQRVTHYLHQAGFSPMNGAHLSRVAMHRTGVSVALAIQYEPSTTLLRLAVSFDQDKPRRGIFRNGRGDLRIFVDFSDLLGLLCWITGSHDELFPNDVDTWLDQVVTLCPATYAVLITRDGRETLALVASTDPSKSLH